MNAADNRDLPNAADEHSGEYRADVEQTGCDGSDGFTEPSNFSTFEPTYTAKMIGMTLEV